MECGGGLLASNKSASQGKRHTFCYYDLGIKNYKSTIERHKIKEIYLNNFHTIILSNYFMNNLNLMGYLSNVNLGNQLW